MDNFNFNLFKYFYYVVIYNGVTNASKNLCVAQPSLSLSIKKLESQLNKNLIDRSNKQFTLTEEGHQLFELLKPIFESIEKNVYFFNNEGKYTELNIGIRYSYAKAILDNVIALFKTNHPNVKLNIDLYSKLDFNKVKNKEYDIVIDDNEYIKQLENVNTTLLCESNNYFICGNLLYNKYKNIKSIKELDGAPLISYRPSLKTGKFKELCYQNNVGFLEMANINESDLYFKLIKDNFGVGFANELLIKEYIKDNSINHLNLSEPIFKDTITIAYTDKKDSIIKDFIEIVKDHTNKELI